ncbi:DUF6236 family protein [Serratia sp. BIGb0163]|uniref:DUF6236 family protein n=1 Tax=Serratia sp. BIGb0163 TaxID=2940613 RepID=UPI0021681985|nr:DUF6236 family protein [Serratia sp. BIGb0163]MCS4265929.1 hypothetical protein [Serratia sp. BIGb0163]
MNKGIILTEGYRADPKTGNFNNQVPISLEDLRFCSLFWDKIENPNSLVYFEPSDDFKVLISEGIASQTKVEIDGIGGNGNGGDWMKELVLKNQMAFMNMQRGNMGIDWSLAQTSDTLSSPSDSNISRAVCEFNLYNAISSPVSDVSIYDVLEFKERRSDELIALRDMIDDSVFRVSSNPEDLNAYRREVSRLESVLNDYNSVMKETGYQTVKRTLTSLLTSPPLGAVAIAGMVPEFAPFMSVVNVVGIGACALGLAYKELIVDKNIPNQHKQFAYLIHAKQELK